MAAAMQGRAEFLAPEILMVPRSGFPPRTTNLSIWLVYRAGAINGGIQGDTGWMRAKEDPMTAVADTSPLNYFIRLGSIDFLRNLSGRVTIPSAVLPETMRLEHRML
jgi:hypothetical protein